MAEIKVGGGDDEGMLTVNFDVDVGEGKTEGGSVVLDLCDATAQYTAWQHAMEGKSDVDRGRSLLKFVREEMGVPVKSIHSADNFVTMLCANYDELKKKTHPAKPGS